MTEPTTAQRPDGGAPTLPLALRPWHLLGAGVAIALLLVASQALEPTERIDEITVDNPTRYDISIRVTGADRDGRITRECEFATAAIVLVPEWSHSARFRRNSDASRRASASAR